MSDSTDTRDRVTGKALCGLVQIDGSDRPESASKFLFGRGVVDAYCGGVLGQCHLTPFIGNFPTRPPVGSLFRPRRPLAVGRFVVAVAVNALKCVSRRAFPHIRNKICRAFLPPLANRNASGPINRISFIARVLASVNCVSQRGYRADACCGFQKSVPCLPRTDLLGPHTAAAISRAAFKASRVYDYFCSAITPKPPKHIPACSGLGPVNLYSNKPAVAKPCSVFSNRHGASYAR